MEFLSNLFKAGSFFKFGVAGLLFGASSLFWDQLSGILSNVFWSLLADFMDFVADKISSFPVPDFLSSLSLNLSGMPPVFYYLIQPINLTYGFTLISAAILARLTIIVIPFVSNLVK